jgi:molecular chaperone DnaK (HSP70)
MDLKTDKLALQRLKEAAEKAKIELSSAATTEINLPFITARMEGGATTPLHLVETITRADLEKMVDALIQRTLEPCKKALADAGISKDKIDEVILVGGMTRMPRVREVVEQFFGAKPHTGVNPDEVVAMGAAKAKALTIGSRSSPGVESAAPAAGGALPELRAPRVMGLVVAASISMRPAAWMLSELRLLCSPKRPMTSPPA